MFTKSNKYLRQKLANWVNLEKKDRFCKKNTFRGWSYDNKPDVIHKM